MFLWLGVLVLLQHGITATDDEDRNEYWTRLNYGLAAVKVKQVCEAEGFWHHVIHLELSQISEGGIPEARKNRLESYNGICMLLKGLL